MAKGQGQGVVLGYLRYVLGFDSLAFEKGLGDADKRLKSAQRSIQKTADKFSNIGKVLTVGLTVPLTAFGVSSVNAASDAAELQSSFNTTFGAMSATMNKWAENTGNAMGRSTQEMQKAANTFGIFFNTAVDPAKAAAMSQTFAKLAQDLGSFFNTDTETAIMKLRSGLSGESEPMRDFGVFLTEASVKAKALQLGLTGVGNELTEQEKIIARYQLIMEGTTKAQGDVARTSGGTANQIRKAKAAFEELQVVVGTKLLPVITPLIEKLGAAIEWFTKLPVPVQNTALAVAAVLAVVGPLSLGIGGLISGFGTMLPLLVKLVPVIATATKALALMALTPIGAVITGIAVAVGAVYLAWRNWDKIQPILSNLYNSVKTYLVDKLGAVFNWLKGKLEAVGGWFYNLYDKVVGHSYIPDMVDAIGHYMARLDSNMVSVAQSATAATAAAFAKLEDDVRPIIERLFPERAAAAGYISDAKLIQGSKVLSGADKAEALSRLGATNANTTTGMDAIAGMMAPISSAAAGVGQAVSEAWNGVEAANDNLGNSFLETTKTVTSALRGLADSVKSGDWLDVLTGVVDLFMGLAGSGAFGGGMQKSVTSFGGFRAGGGPVSAGRSYMVGERGPEMFTASRSGYISPNGKGGASQRPTVVQLVVGAGQMFEPAVAAISGNVSVQTVSASANASYRRGRQRLG